MGQFIVTGGQRLNGELTVEGAKNAVLPILAATVINGGINVIHNCPQLHDVDIMFDILRGLGCKLKIEGTSIQVDSSSVNSSEIPEKLAVEMRSSIFLMGPMLARCKNVTISYPGGCVSSLAHLLKNSLKFIPCNPYRKRE